MPNRETSGIASLRHRPLLYQVAQEEIKSYILRHELKPGDPLPTEAELAEYLDISRTSVREAVKSLEALGVLEARVGMGLFVRDFSFDPLLSNLAYGLMVDLKQLNDIIEVRFHLEAAMADQAVAAVTPEQMQSIRAILERMRMAATAGQYSAEDDRAFHQALWVNVDNGVLRKIVDVFWEVLYRARERRSVPEVEDPAETYRQHVAIADALEQRDLAAVRLAMHRHWGYPNLKLAPPNESDERFKLA